MMENAFNKLLKQSNINKNIANAKINNSHLGEDYGEYWRGYSKDSKDA